MERTTLFAQTPLRPLGPVESAWHAEHATLMIAAHVTTIEALRFVCIGNTGSVPEQPPTVQPHPSSPPRPVRSPSRSRCFPFSGSPPPPVRRGTTHRSSRSCDGG